MLFLISVYILFLGPILGFNYVYSMVIFMSTGFTLLTMSFSLCI